MKIKIFSLQIISWKQTKKLLKDLEKTGKITIKKTSMSMKINSILFNEWQK